MGMLQELYSLALKAGFIQLGKNLAIAPESPKANFLKQIHPGTKAWLWLQEPNEYPVAQDVAQDKTVLNQDSPHGVLLELRVEEFKPYPEADLLVGICYDPTAEKFYSVELCYQRDTLRSVNYLSLKACKRPCYWA